MEQGALSSGVRTVWGNGGRGSRCVKVPAGLALRVGHSQFVCLIYTCFSRHHTPDRNTHTLYCASGIGLGQIRFCCLACKTSAEHRASFAGPSQEIPGDLRGSLPPAPSFFPFVFSLFPLSIPFPFLPSGLTFPVPMELSAGPRGLFLCCT